jgi:transcriptional regulator with XRE-family HTH domain
MARGNRRVERLRKLLIDRRKAKKLGQEEVGELVAPFLDRAGLTKQAISQWERGVTEPGIPEFEAWALGLGMRLHVDLHDAEDERIEVPVGADLVETATRLNDLSGEDREIVSGLVRRLTRDVTD